MYNPRRSQRLRLAFFLGISMPKIKAIAIPRMRIFNYSFLSPKCRFYHI
jgi:hypothetical protein